ncbi:MAG: hypothetical protein HY246_01140 [Proteobacteria bacterium]|nr:hypothetical protein [Pseudomonadota bacterium]
MAALTIDVPAHSGGGPFAGICGKQLAANDRLPLIALSALSGDPGRRLG